MKKRILALALAGTTAFSVFGAAISANAATITWGSGSSHDGTADGAYYQSYKPAGDIRWSTKFTDAQKGTANVDFYGNAGLVNSNGVLTAGSTVYTLGSTTGFAGKGYTVKDLTKENGYFATLGKFMEAQGYKGYTLKADGSFEVTTTSGNTETTTTYVVATENGYTETNTQYVIFPKDGVKTGYTQVSGTNNWEVYVSSFNAGSKVYVPTSVEISGTGKYNLNKDVADLLSSYAKRNGMYYIADKANSQIVEATNLTKYAFTTQVYTSVATTDQGVYTDAGYKVLNSVDVTDIDAILAEPVSANGVVYLYDYYYDETYPTAISADKFADAWADGTLTKLLKDANAAEDSGVIYPEIGISYRSVRGEVMYAWEDFLDNLGISDPSNVTELTLWGEKTIENYAYTYKDAMVVTDAHPNTDGSWTITYTTGWVDLYNFEDLVADILELAPAAQAQNAQTSELVYLMQQYDKYVTNGFVDVEPVETDDWGDLLMSLIQAPTEDDFRTSAAYKRYTNAAEDLVEQYTEAETSVAVGMAETNMYNFVTKYNSAYTTSTTSVDKTALTSAIDATYFNANWKAVGEDYGYTQGRNDGILDSNKVVIDSNYKAAWALYPVADYAVGYSTPNYPGVADTLKPIDANDSYRWFYNVYALSYNIYNNNKYQSVVDAAAEALNEAVENLTISSAYASPASYVLRAEEQNDKLANLIETDYNASIWANRNKINSYINDKVSNDVIGKQGSANASIIAADTAELMSWQSYQTVITRTDITSVKNAQANANTALTALRNDQDNYNAAQANALTKAIDNCQYIIDLYDGVYGKTASVQSVDDKFSAAVGDKDQILKSMITAAVEEVDAAINFKEVLQGWHEFDEGWKYGTEEGYLTGGWKQVPGDKSWYYFNEDGIALENEWIKENGKWYYLNSNCAAAYGWAKVDGKWYYFNGDNSMRTGWVKTGGHWYYLNAGGAMVTGWAQIDGKWYYFKKSENALGQMEYSTTVDGYKLGADGAWIK